MQTPHFLSELRERVSDLATQLNPRRMPDPVRRTCALSAGAVLALGSVVMGTAEASRNALALDRTAAVSDLAPAQPAPEENAQPAPPPAEAPAPAAPAPEESPAAEPAAEPAPEPAAEPAAEPAEEAASVPLDSLRVTSPFGWRENPLLGNGALEWHTGIDFGAPMGTPVKSTAPGTVVYAEYHQYGGLRIVVDHGDGVQTTYNHLNEIWVEVGQEVGFNEVIGSVGSTGNSTGPHLHFEVLLNEEYQDPAVWLGL